MKHQSIALAGAMLFLALSSSAQAPASATVEGRVTSAVTGEPLRANVFLAGAFFGRGGTSVTTDAGGEYRVSVPAGTYRISAACGVCSTQSYGQKTPSGTGKPVTLPPRGVLKVDFKLSPTAVISGRVVDQEGEPISRVKIQAYVYRYGGRGDVGELLSGLTAATNDRGEYRLFGLQPGEYFVGLTEGQTYPQVFFPGTLNPDSAQAIRLQPGMEFGDVDFKMSPAKAVAVRGRVLSSSGRPVPRVDVSIRRASRLIVSTYDPGARTFTDNDGTFEILAVPPGSYNLAAGSRESGWARVRIEVADSDVKDLTAVLQPRIDIPGKIVLESEPSQPFSMSRLFITLESVDGESAVPAKIGADGTFLVPGLIPGNYRFSMSRADSDGGRAMWAGLPQGHIEAARSGRVNAIGSFAVSTAGDSLEVIVGFQTGLVAGTVLDAMGNSYPNAFVSLVPDEPRRSRFELTFTGASDAQGRFSLNGVPAGGYRLFAWEEQPAVGSGALFDPQFMQRFEAQGTPVRVERNATAEVQVNVIPSL